MSAPTLAQLLQAITPQQAYTALLGVYQKEGFPTTAWPPGGVDNTRTLAYAAVVTAMVDNYLPAIAGGGYLSTAQTDWLRLLAAEIFQLQYFAAQNTVGVLTLTAASGSGPYTFNPGDLTFVFGTSGNRYVNNLNGGTIPLSGSTTVIVYAENPGSSYNDPNNSGGITLVNSLAGVTISNPAGTYSPVAHIGAGTGTLTLGGSPIGPHQVYVQINDSGASGVADWSYSLDGAPFVDAGAVAALTNIGGVGINITLVNGGSGTSFAEGDTYLFQAPGSWITTQGTDDETNAALSQRCIDRWALQSGIASLDYYDFLARNTPGVLGQVTQSICLTDTNINNKINIVVAGPQGILPVGAVATIQAYISSRPAITDFPVVVSPSSLDITFAGTLTVPFSKATAAANALTVALTNYVNNGGINPTFEIAQVIAFAISAGYTNVNIGSVTINGANVDLVLGSSTSFVVGSMQPTAFTVVTQ